MATYLLTWNPKRYPWGALSDELSAMRMAGRVAKTWSVGNNKRIREGDRFLMIRLGKEPRGIIGAGTFMSSPFQARHWDRLRAKKGDTASYASIEFDALSELPVVPIDLLKKPPYGDVNWSSQISGISIPTNVAKVVERELKSLADQIHISLPDEISPTEGPFLEGAVRKVLVDAFERSSEARKVCLQVHGMSCSVYDMNFRDTYGEVASDVIHVHHLNPISASVGEYIINPVKDLVPVCPNCHAVIHLHNPPYSISQVRALRGQASAGRKPTNKSLERSRDR